MEDGVSSLAFGHRDIPARQVDIVDETPAGVVLSNEEARGRGLFHSGQRDPTLINSRPKCIWLERHSKRVKTGKENVRQMLGFDEEEDEIAEDDDEEDDSGGRSRTTSRGNPFILSSCAESRKRHHDDSDSD